MNQRSPRHAARLGLLPAGIALALVPAFAVAQDAETGAEATTLDRIEVTGSRIKRAAIEGALPITVIDRAEIEASGDISVADFLRGTSFNSFGSFRPQSGSSAQSFAGISLRGLGAARTLVLIDGRRAPVAPTTGQGQDLNIIPMAAVERVEILLDGASSVYGSDAIGGVINIITRSDYEGAEITVGKSFPIRPGGDTEEGNALMGFSTDRGHLLASISYENRDIIFQRDRPWSSGGFSVFSNNFWSRNQLSFGALVGPVPGGCEDPGFTDIGFLCGYDFTALAADEAAIGNRSLVTSGAYDINNDWTFYGRGVVSRVKSFGRYAPVPSSPWPGGLIPISPESPNHPNNAVPGWTGQTDTIYLTHRFAALGPRDANIDSNLYDLNLGFEGRVGGVDLDFGVRRNEYQTYDFGLNYVVAAIAGEAIESGEYNIYDPDGNDPDTLRQFTATISRRSNTKLEEVYGSAGFDLFEMGGGLAAAVVGAEYRKEDYADIYDSLSEAGQIVGSAGNSAGGGRSVRAVYGEVLLPVFDNFEVNLSARHDSYSDYGSDTSPKVSLRYQPLDTLTFRGSYGQGFRAPTLDLVTQQPAFGAAGTTHAPTCEVLGGGAPCSTQVTTFSIANPGLGSEKSDQWALGTAWDATDWLNMSLDYYNISIEDQIAFIGINQVVGCLEGTIDVCPSGLSRFPAGTRATAPDSSLGLGVEFGSQGEIVFGQIGATNLGTIDTYGFDFNARTRFDLGGWGNLRQQLQISNPLSFRTNGGPSTVGRPGAPRYRGVLQNAWSMADWEFAWNLNYIHGTQSTKYREFVVASRTGDQETIDDLAAEGLSDTLPSWVTHDLQLSYNAPWNAKVTLGVTNVADKDPVIDPRDPTGRGFDFSLYDGYGRVPYFRYTQRF
ncbi:TonB-dependent receptor plug domain-containing protein [Lysobacter sp. D1-1-M9]|uniref:TonB-dependent receptor plug domain-containing protein n=1 Tax=Novilysobacter longmucuonensis TaxID=3098603 RepID=UPI002FC6084B